MPVVSCPHCSNPVHAPPDWPRAGYTCPHCRKPVGPRPDEDDEFDLPPPRPGARRRSDSPVMDFLAFRLMITPILIQIAFWLGTLTCVVLGARMMIGSFEAVAEEPRPVLRDARDNPFNNPERPKANAKPAREFSFALFASGLAVAVLGPVLIRILCELDIILFKIHDELKESDNRHRNWT